MEREKLEHKQKASEGYHSHDVGKPIGHPSTVLAHNSISVEGQKKDLGDVELEQHGQEVPVIALANAVVEPLAVVVEVAATPVAIVAVLGAFKHVYFAQVAV